MTNSGHIIFGQTDEVIFGKPAAEAVDGIASRLGASRIFLMVSGSLNKNTDEIDKIRSALGERYVGTFDSMPAHTPRISVIEASEQAREAGADLIVTVGGGSITDGAKAAQLCLANDVRTAEGMDMFRLVTDEDGSFTPPVIKPPQVRQVSVPTTLSGGDFTLLCGITDGRTKTKELYRHPYMVPQAVILDPAITVHTPEWLWLSTGIRAVDNCVEGVSSLASNAFGDAQGLQGIRLFSEELLKVKSDPSNLDARLGCQMATWLSTGPYASGAPMGASHAIGYVLGSMYGVPHGHTSCVMLPSVMRWNKQANAEQQQKVAAAMGRPGEDAGDLLEELISNLGLPGTLAEVGIGPDKFEIIAEASMPIPWIPHNPRPITNASQIMEILRMAA